MGPLGTQELVFIFILALLLFGPKKLPELGKTIGKAMTEFRRAQSELKTTFNREMQNLERETGIQELAANTFQTSTYNYDQSSYDPSYYESGFDGSYNSTPTGTPALPDATASLTTADGASATQGAGTTATLQIQAADGSIASGHLEPLPVPAENWYAPAEQHPAEKTV